MNGACPGVRFIEATVVAEISGIRVEIAMV